MSRHNQLQTALSLTFVASLAACGSDESPDADLGSVSSGNSLRTKDELGLALAKNLASHLGDPALRRYINDMAHERFDGDYNFLVQAARFDRANAAAGPRLDEIFASDANTESTSDVDEFMDELAGVHPLAQIALPQLNDPAMDWDPEHEIPLVVYVPSKRTSDVLWAFDVDGMVHEISASKAPSELVLVVNENERTEVVEAWRAMELISPPDPQSLYEYEYPCIEMQDPVLETDYYTYLPAGMEENVARCGGGGGGGGLPPPPPPPPGGGGPVPGGGCDRDANLAKDRLYRMKFNSMNAFNGANEWFDGGQDIQVEIIFAQPNGAIGKVSKLIQGSDGDFKNCNWLGLNCSPAWKTTNLEVVHWDPAIYGTALLYHWREKDSGASQQINVSSTSSNGVTVGTTLTVTDGDDILGESIVEYCDIAAGTGSIYNTGSVQFEVRL